MGVLNGAWIFLADLARALPRDVSVDFLGARSYGTAAASSGEVRITRELEQDIAGRDVLLVEDIVDTGYTLARILPLLEARGPRSLATVTLLDKPSQRRVEVPVTYVGFEIPDRFVVGYGLDHAGRYRDLPDLRILEDA